MTHEMKAQVHKACSEVAAISCNGRLGRTVREMPPRFVQCTVCVTLRSGKTVNVSESRHEQLRALAQDPENPENSAEAMRARKLLQQVFGKEVYLVHFQSLRKKEKIQLPRWETSQIYFLNPPK